MINANSRESTRTRYPQEVLPVTEQYTKIKGRGRREERGAEIRQEDRGK
jgi:hypothetical protein